MMFLKIHLRSVIRLYKFDLKSLFSIILTNLHSIKWSFEIEPHFVVQCLQQKIGMRRLKLLLLFLFVLVVVLSL